MKRMSFTFLNWNFEIRNALHNWRHFKIHKNDYSWHLVWGKLSICIENWTLEVHPVCAECGSVDIGEVYYGDEGLTVCQCCNSIEQGCNYVNLKKFDQAC